MSKRLGMGGHQGPVNLSDEWLTPPEIIADLGPFDLDPCAAPDPRPWDTARRHITREENGLRAEWDGRVWLNPPYGGPSIVGPWLERMATHGSGTALIFARTETDLFHRFVWGRATAILFLRGRLFFHRPDGSRAMHNAGAPSCLVAYGERDVDCLLRTSIDGFLVSPPA